MLAIRCLLVHNDDGVVVVMVVTVLVVDFFVIAVAGVARTWGTWGCSTNGPITEARRTLAKEIEKDAYEASCGICTVNILLACPAKTWQDGAIVMAEMKSQMSPEADSIIVR